MSQRPASPRLQERDPALESGAAQANSQTYVPFVESFIEHIWEQRVRSLIQRL